MIKQFIYKITLLGLLSFFMAGCSKFDDNEKVWIDLPSNTIEYQSYMVGHFVSQDNGKILVEISNIIKDMERFNNKYITDQLLLEQILDTSKEATEKNPKLSLYINENYVKKYTAGKSAFEKRKNAVWQAKKLADKNKAELNEELDSFRSIIDEINSDELSLYLDIVEVNAKLSTDSGIPTLEEQLTFIDSFLEESLDKLDENDISYEYLSKYDSNALYHNMAVVYFLSQIDHSLSQLKSTLDTFSGEQYFSNANKVSKTIKSMYKQLTDNDDVTFKGKNLQTNLTETEEYLYSKKINEYRVEIRSRFFDFVNSLNEKTRPNLSIIERFISGENKLFTSFEEQTTIKVINQPLRDEFEQVILSKLEKYEIKEKRFFDAAMKGQLKNGKISIFNAGLMSIFNKNKKAKTEKIIASLLNFTELYTEGKYHDLALEELQRLNYSSAPDIKQEIVVKDKVQERIQESDSKKLKELSEQINKQRFLLNQLAETYHNLVKSNKENDEINTLLNDNGKHLTEITHLLYQNNNAKNIHSIEAELENLTLSNQSLQQMIFSNYQSDPNLSDIEQGINTLKSYQASPSTDIENILLTATEQIIDEKLTYPENDNAFESYNTILSIDPDNQQAKDGLQIILNKLKIKAMKALNNGDMNAARNYLNEATHLFPNDEQLNQLIDKAESMDYSTSLIKNSENKDVKLIDYKNTPEKDDVSQSIEKGIDSTVDFTKDLWNKVTN